MAKTYYLEITEANHTDNQFYTLGGAGWDTATERNEQYKSIPTYGHDCDNDDKCYFLDVVQPNGDRIKEKEISAATAMTLLGVSDLTPLRENAIADLEAEIARAS